MAIITAGCEHWVFAKSLRNIDFNIEYLSYKLRIRSQKHFCSQKMVNKFHVTSHTLEPNVPSALLHIRRSQRHATHYNQSRCFVSAHVKNRFNQFLTQIDTTLKYGLETETQVENGHKRNRFRCDRRKQKNVSPYFVIRKSNKNSSCFFLTHANSECTNRASRWQVIK